MATKVVIAIEVVTTSAIGAKLHTLYYNDGYNQVSPSL